MYPEFAYSVPMQIILACITFFESFCSMYMLSNITLAALGSTAHKKEKALFAFITGILLHSVPVYGLYLLGGGVSFGRIALLVIVTPNPVFGLIYYFAALKIFKFSFVRSLKLVGYIYVFWIAAKTISRISGATLFIQNEVRYNYLKDAFQQATYLLIFFIIYRVIMYGIRRGRYSFSFVENIFINEKKALLWFFLKASYAFAVRFTLPLVLTEQAIAFVLALILLTLSIVVNICLDNMASNRQTISNHEVHINVLFNGMDELKGIKHDFNNILHTYSGYLELKEYERLERYHASLVSATSHAASTIELARKMPENPAVVSLLISKFEYAESRSVNLRVSLRCELDDLYIDNMDVTRILACLLDNAIEAADGSEQRKVFVTIESKSKDSKLIIITNSTTSVVEPNTLLTGGTTKPGHKGLGLSVVRKMLAKYGNCTFQLKYYDHEFSAYVELKDAT